MPKRMLVTSWICEDGPLYDSARAAGVEILMARRPTFRSEPEMLDLLASLGGKIDAAIAASDVYSDAVLNAGQFKIVSRVGVGFDSVDVAAATRRGVVVSTTPGTNHDSVADHAFGLILALARQIVPHNQFVRAQQWKRLTAADVHGQTIGILGLGKIGKGIARRARGFDMRVIAYDPIWDAEFARQNQVERLPLETVIAESDFLSLHLPATPETEHVIDARRLALMKPTAYLINAARGSLVDEAALFDALQSKRIAGAGLDVFEQEPPWGTRLIEIDNVILTPHVAGFSVKANAAMARMAVENALLVLAGKQPLFCVNPEIFESTGR